MRHCRLVAFVDGGQKFSPCVDRKGCLALDGCALRRLSSLHVSAEIESYIICPGTVEGGVSSASGD